MTVEPTYLDITRLVHRWEHLAAIKGKGRPEGLLAVECWQFIEPCGVMPDWAAEARAKGEPPSAWCPVVSPFLLVGVSTPAD